MAKFPDNVKYYYVAPRLGLGYFVAKDKIAQESCLSTLVCSAIVGGVATSKKYKSGKTMYYAFKVPFVGESAGDGRLIEGAQPRWNIWSNNSPGEWTLPIIESGDPAIKVLDFRLKRDSSNQVRYNEADFGGYDPDAIPPSLPNIVAVDIANIERDIMVHDIELGSYDWKKVSSALQYARLVKINSNGAVEYLSDAVSLSTPNFNIPIHVKIPTVETSEEMYLALCNSLGDIQAYLPNPGSLTLVPASYTVVVITIKIQTGSYSAMSKTKATQINSSSSTWGGQYINNAMLRNCPACYLTRITYVAQNSNGEVMTKERTGPFTAQDFPTSWTDFHEGALGQTLSASVRADSEIRSFAGLVGGTISVTMLLT